MMKNIALSRPATSAIAAFLVLSTPAALAQETPTVTTAPTTSTPPPVAEPAPAPATTAPQAATTQPVIRLPVDLAPAPQPAPPADPAPKATERQTAAPVRTQRAAPRQRAAAPTPAATRAATPKSSAPVTSTAAPEEAAPAVEPVMLPTEPSAEAAPPPVAQARTSNDAFPREIAGGAAALLLMGGAGFAFARRRRASREVWEFEETAEREWVPGATAEAAGPTFTPREEAIVPTAEPTPVPVVAPEPRSTPTFAAAPSGSMGRHEAMAMAGPTPENPFATLSKRLARARFLDRQEREAYEATLAGQQVPAAPQEPARKPVSAWEIAQRDIPAPVQQEVRRPEPGRVRTNLKPDWLRN